MTTLRDFDYTVQGISCKGRLALPPGAGPHPGVLVMHSANGLGDHVYKRALLLAEAGYAALATDMYGGGRHFDDPMESGKLFMALVNEPKLMRDRIVGTFETFRAVPQVDARRVGAIGFCFGGQCVLELARSGADAKAVISFHGLLTTAFPARPNDIKAKMLVIAGARDPFAPKKDIAAFEDEMTAAGADWQMTVYGEGFHSFTDPSTDKMGHPGIRYNAVLDKLSWAQSMTYLDAMLK